MKKCFKCSSIEELYNYSGNKYFICRPCNTQKKSAALKTKKGMDAAKRSVEKYEKLHPERRRAWSKAGRAIPLQPCEVCGNKRVHRHHPDPSRPLDIVFLCPLHHKQTHKEIKVVQ